MSQGKVKGSIMLETVKYIRASKEKSRALVPDHLQHYLSDRILVSRWYPEEDHLGLNAVTVQLYAGVGAHEDPEAWAKLSRDSAALHYGGTYSSLVTKGNPARTLSRYGTLWQLRHDTGEVELESISPTEAIVRLSGYALLSSEQCASIRGSIEGLIEVAGAREVASTHPLCRMQGDAVCEWHFRWKL